MFFCLVYVMNVCGVCDVYVWCVHVCGVCGLTWCVYVCTCVCGVRDVCMVEHEETSLRRALEDKQGSRVGVEGVG